MMRKQSISDLVPLPLAIDSLEKELKDRGEYPDLPLKTMPDLNLKLWGIHKRKLCVIGARTSNGKSVMAINIAYDIATQGKNVLFLSLEMPIYKIIERLFCLDQEVNNIELLKNGYNKNEEIRRKFLDFRDKYDKAKMVISDCIGKDWNFVDEALTKFKVKPDLIVLDHIQEIRGSGQQKSAIDEHISKMRESAIRNNFALVVCSQVNRIAQTDKEDKEPQLHHLKATGFLEEAADQCLLLHWPWHYDNEKVKNEILINVAKNRDGMTGRIKMSFTPEYYRIRDFAKTEQKEKEVNIDWTE